MDDGLRRGMYEFIRAARRPVTREDAAAAVGISTKLAAFHLDKLVRAKLLQSHYARSGGTRKVGRTPRVYEPVADDIRISLPQRRHDVLAAVLVDAVTTQGDDETTRDAVTRAAHEHGRARASESVGQRRPGRLGAERALTLCHDVLSRCGYQPDRESPGSLRLRSCPFHPMAARQPALVCTLNQALLTGFLAGLDAHTVQAVLEPSAGECCVRLRATPSR
jgi:predicted ArsR family transcriptional regulator